MNIQTGNNHYLNSLKSDGVRLSEELFLDKNKKTKATYEIKKENGYMRHYVTKLTGEKVLVKETKLTETQKKEMSEGGDIKDVINEMTLKALNNVVDNEHFNKFSKIGLAGEKEKQLEKYSSGI